MTKHRTALILQGMILVGLLLAAVISAPTRAATNEAVRGQGTGAVQVQADQVRMTAEDRH